MNNYVIIKSELSSRDLPYRDVSTTEFFFVVAGRIL